RGIGLDAVKQQLARVGGVISLSPADGAGTCVRISLPVPARRISVLMFQVPGVDISFAVTGEWTLEDRPAPRGAAPIDLARAVGLNGRVPARGAQARCFRRRGRVPAEVWVAMAGDAIAATAERIAATSDDQAIEIVRIAGTYAIVVRLDRVSRRV
ncbi:MAG TPA: hypothetical protein VFG83_02240, partial [Kofleriaceae bacterium]|nr:hypothetical protein [Kofleriaceae bacterium]